MLSNETSKSPVHLERRGLILILSSPSGAGKTTLSKRLLANHDNLKMSVSVTTRPKRDGEIDGKDYHFIGVEEFKRRRDQDELIEWAVVFENYYGTPRAAVETMIDDGFDVLFDIDWQGAQQLSSTNFTNLVRVFILPPSAEALDKRLRDRGLDTDEVVAQRMLRASGEISHWDDYDYVLINDDLEHSYTVLNAILHAERHRKDLQTGLPDFVRKLQATL